MRPDLRQITLCAADTRTPALAARALRLSAQGCDFGDAVLFTDQPQPDSAFRCEAINPLHSADDYSRFIFKELAERIHTPFALIVQWDGHVLAPQAWDPAFLAHDYIGARWVHFNDGMGVGNGGFSLRSRRLLEATAGADFAWVPQAAEDILTCRTYRARLSAECGISFAPDAVADAFAYETLEPQRPTFGFHGLYNLWRHAADPELLQVVSHLDTQAQQSRGYVLLMAQCAGLRRFAAAAPMHATLRQHLSPEAVYALLLHHLGSRHGAQRCQDMLSALEGGPLWSPLPRAGGSPRRAGGSFT